MKTKSLCLFIELLDGNNYQTAPQNQIFLFYKSFPINAFNIFRFFASIEHINDTSKDEDTQNKYYELLYSKEASQLKSPR